MIATPRCPKCGQALPPDAPAGFCPGCLIDLGAGVDVGGEDGLAPSSQPHAARNTPHVLATFGDYMLLEEIARGGMGVVFKARQISLNRTVAVKMILAGQLASDADVKRFRAEAEAAANLKHPNIVSIHEVGEHEGQHYFSMDFIEGQSLAELVRDGPLPPQRAARYVQIIAEAIHYAHQRGTLHRDLKPSNVLIDTHDQPHVTDFGLAKQLKRDSEVTLTGQILGSPNYMPPEQAAGKTQAVGSHSDVYGLGAILYHLLTGRPPFVADTVHGTLTQVMTADPVAPRLLNSGVPRDMETICLKCLIKDSRRRYRSAEELAEELGRFQSGEPIHARPVSPPEKLWRWCRRKPALSSLGAALFLVFAGGSAGILWQWQRAEGNARQAGIHAEKESLERQHAEEVVTRLEILRTEDLFAKNESSAALAYLARVLRQRPTNQVAATRLLSALTQRNFALPVTRPFRHEAEVLMAQFSPDGTRVATASRDKTARLWNVQTGAPIGPPLQHDSTVLTVQFSPDGRWLVSASSDKTARIWDTRTGLPAVGPLRHKATVHSAEFSHDGRWVLTASSDKTARVWSAQTGQLLPQVFEHAGAVTVAEFSPDDRFVLTASADGTARVWDADTGQARTPPLQHGAAVRCALFSPDGRRVATGANDLTARVWDAQTGLPITGRLRHDNWVTALDFSPDGKRLVTAEIAYLARVWNVETGQLVGSPFKSQDRVTSAQFSPDGRYLLTASLDRKPRVWNLETGGLFLPPLRHDGRVNWARFSLDGKFVVTASDDHTAQLWDVRQGWSQPISLRQESAIWAARFSPDGRHVVTGSYDGTAQAWDAHTGQTLGPPVIHVRRVDCANFDPRGNRVVTAAVGNACIWDLRTGQSVTPRLHRGERLIRYAEFSPDGQRVLTACDDVTAKIWDASSGEIRVELKGHMGGVYSARFSPDGGRVATSSSDKTSIIWNARTGQPLFAPMRHEGIVSMVVFSPDGLRVATASRDGAAMIWNALSGQRLIGPLKHDGAVNSVQFSFDGTKVVTASLDGTSRIWDARTGILLTEPLKHGDEVLGALFSPDANRVVTSCGDGAARVWDSHTGHLLCEPFQHQDRVVAAEFSPDQQWLVSASFDHAARIWFVPLAPRPIPEWLTELAEALAGGRIDDSGSLTAVPVTAILDLKEKIRANSSTDSYTRWARWFFADRSTRTLSPESSMTLPEYVPGRVQKNTPASLTPAVELLNRASELSPTSAEFWNTKGGMLEEASKFDDAWQSYSQCIELAKTNSASAPIRHKALLNRSKLSVRMNRIAEATADNLAAWEIPARLARASSNLIDLSLHYNVSLTKDRYGRGSGNNLAELPMGLQILGGTEFDLRGLIHLSCPMLEQWKCDFPRAVSGIRVQQNARRIHVLHSAAAWNPKDNLHIGNFILHYLDGEMRELPIRCGDHVWNWWFDPKKPEPTKVSSIAWTGQNRASRAANSSLRLFKTTWDNPRPDVVIVSIDYVSTMTDVGPFLIAITLE